MSSNRDESARLLDGHRGRRRGGKKPGRRTVLALGTTLFVAGLASIAWGVVTWYYGDPVTALYTRRAQSSLADELERKGETFAAVRQASARPLAPKQPTVANARAYRATVKQGDAVGRLLVPRLDLDVVIVYGTDADVLRRGPGVHEETALPGQGELVYVAGHRTTFGAPFAHIDRLDAGDVATLDMPYGRYVYRVTGHAIVDDNDLSVLRSAGREILKLQACHPRFRATQRYIVSARLERVLPPPA